MVPEKLLNSVLNYEISKNSLETIFKKIDEILNGEKLDLIVGGPPCQAYSLVGRARDENRMVGDSRNYLYILLGILGICGYGPCGKLICAFFAFLFGSLYLEN